MYHFTVHSVRPSLSPISRLRRPPLTIERMSTSRLARRLPRPYSPSSSVSMTRPCRISEASRETKARAAESIEGQIGRAHVGNPVTNAHHVCSVLLEKQKQ